MSELAWENVAESLQVTNRTPELLPPLILTLKLNSVGQKWVFWVRVARPKHSKTEGKGRSAPFPSVLEEFAALLKPPMIFSDMKRNEVPLHIAIHQRRICDLLRLQTFNLFNLNLAPFSISGFQRCAASLKPAPFAGALRAPANGARSELTNYDSDTTAQFGYHNDIEFTRYLIQEVGVAVVPGSSFFQQSNQERSYVRFCFSKTPETLQAARERLQQCEV